MLPSELIQEHIDSFATLWILENFSAKGRTGIGNSTAYRMIPKDSVKDPVTLPLRATLESILMVLHHDQEDWTCRCCCA